MGFYIDRDSKTALRNRAKLRASLSRLAAALDGAGKQTAPITLPCSYVDLCKLGLVPYEQRSFLFGTHPVRAGA